MKRLAIVFICLSLFCTELLQAQDSSAMVARLVQLPSAGVAMNQGWKFHSGDDSSWANANFDDRSWMNVDLSKPESYLKEFSTKEVGWFRLKLWIDSSLRANPVALIINQLGASDIYVNSALLIRLGNISAAHVVETNNPHGKPFLLQGNLGGDTMYFAVRFASPVPRPAWLLTNTAQTPLSIRVSPWPDAVNEYKTALLAPRTSLGYSFMTIGLGLLFVLLYTFFPKERINILFAAFCFCIGMGPVLTIQLQEGNLNMNVFGWTGIALEVISKCTGMAMLSIIAVEVLGRITIYQLSLIFFIVVIDTLLSIFLGPSPTRMIIGNLSRAFFTAELLRLTWIAIKQRNLIISAVGLSSATLNTTFLLVVVKLIPFHYSDTVTSLSNYFCFIMITIYVATKYSTKSKELNAQLAEINQLSQQNIEKEREKQQLLALQNEMLEKQVAERTEALTHSLTELKETQSQLIQSEKMASLGELTAGIAHEIQNPLNFVNNFSEINAELIDEMGKAIEDNNLDEVKSLSADIRQNQEKISHHGRRADSIVKSMLQHSRTSTGQKEETDINDLADEYLRLSYHGLRAKDKSFNATLNSNLDPAVGFLEIVPQNLGRVLLNLFNNAFYSVSEKKKKTDIAGTNDNSATNRFVPTVWLSTKRYENRIDIVVKVNGLGISKKILDKIFQPFFTSKPVGQGTGLGLSLSYDIVTKEHHGQLSVNAVEGEYAEFVVSLPLSV